MRAPRSSPSANAAPTTTKNLLLADPATLRKSPRLLRCSDAAEPGVSSPGPSRGLVLALVASTPGLSTRRSPRSEEAKPATLRKSPRLAPCSDAAESGVSTPRPSRGLALALVDSTPGLSTRKSPRFASGSEEVKPSDSARGVSLRTPPRLASSGLRKSPRLFSGTGELNVSEMEGFATPIAPRRSPRTQEAVPSELHSEESKILYLTHPDSLRRSPRFTPSLPEVKPRNSTLRTSRTTAPTEQNSSRRSPRISEPEKRAKVDSPRFAPSLPEAKPRDSTTRTSLSTAPAEQKSSRRSPRISEPEKCTKVDSPKLSRESDKAKIPEDGSTRRSSRLSPAANGGEKSKDSKSQKRSFSELGSSEVEENGDRASKRAANLRAKVNDNINDVINSAINEVADEIDEKRSKVSSDELSESGADELMLLVDELAESDLIDGPVSYDDEHHSKKIEAPVFATYKGKGKPGSCFFVGDPIPAEEAQERWRWRYEIKADPLKHSQESGMAKTPKETSRRKSSRFSPDGEKINYYEDQVSNGPAQQDDDDEDEIIFDVDCHYAQASIENCIYSLGDCAYIKGDEEKKHVGRIVEFFKATDGENYFRVQWFYPVEDTVINGEGAFHDKRRLFYSTIMNDNPIDCIISKVRVIKITPRVGQKIGSISPSDFFYDMEYCVDYSTFRSLDTDTKNIGSTDETIEVRTLAMKTHEPKLALLDLYSGCGGMSTGLNLGTKLAGVDLVTKWSVDCNDSACESLKLNHPETNVRNEGAEDFLILLKEWEKLCKQYRFTNNGKSNSPMSKRSEEATNEDDTDEDSDDDTDEDSDKEDLEVSMIVDICYGDPNNTKKRGLYFQVNWKGYGSSEDTWEPVEGLSNCKQKIEDFVQYGMEKKLLPLPMDVDVICGGPPCQGISGYNRFRNVESPLEDERNRQIVVFMDIVNFLKPSYVLMENVVDILRFDKGSLGRYALSRLVHLRYQARLGIMASGCYGLPQFRLRVFLWAALPHENLPPFPLPTHDVVIRYWPPLEFERNIVAYDENQPRDLEDALFLKDAISDLQPVTNDESREEMPYSNPPETEFQRYIRSTKSDWNSCAVNGDEDTKCTLYDHRALRQNEDDYIRICKIPKRKGATFRDLPGVLVGSDNVARRDPDCEDIILPSGANLLPNYVFTYEQGRSKRPFSRLWWDETVPTVLTCPSCHNLTCLHPEQDRILTLREYARLQGFPDHFRFCGNIKQRYCQVGNAVSVNVSRALGFSLGLAIRKLSSNEPLLTLPRKFSLSTYSQLTSAEPEPEHKPESEREPEHEPEPEPEHEPEPEPEHEPLQDCPEENTTPESVITEGPCNC